MASVTSYTAERMQEIEDQAITGGHITGGHLILERNNGGTIDAGSVIGPPGPTGPSGPVGGSTGAVDNAIIRANGTGGTTVQSSGITIDDSDRLTAPLMTVTTAPSVGTDVVNKTYSDKSGRGLLGIATTTTAESCILNNWKSVDGLSITITPVVGRYYRFNYSTSFVGDPAVGITLSVYKSSDLSNPVVRTDGGTHAVSWPSTINSSRVILIPSGWDVLTTFLVRMYVTGFVDTSSNANAAYFTIEDVGAP